MPAMTLKQAQTDGVKRRSNAAKNWLPEKISPLSVNARVAIIGAGISGATVAAELASAGMLVTLFEAMPEPAMMASGNLAGSCLPVVDRGNAPYNQWYWQSWRLACQWWERQDDRQSLGDLSSAFKWSRNASKQSTWHQWIEELNQPALVQWQAPLDNAPDIHGVHFKQGGYFVPKQVVKRLLTHSRIQLRTQCLVHAIQQEGHAWCLVFDQGLTETFDAVVLAAGASAADLLPEWQDYLQLNKGQVSHVLARDWLSPPKMVLSYGGYATPAVADVTCVGATFEGNVPLGLTPAGQAHNLSLLRQVLPEALKPEAQPIGGHSAYRVMTSDHLPLVGQALSVLAYQERIRACVLHPDTCPDATAALKPNLWFSLGQGSRGLTSSFLSAALLRAQMTGQALPVSDKLKQAVHPARIIFRQMVQKALK
jgi:tRNA 5-methylaminomethyl-2-thiouridine biosynthesis bifunctional protein